MIKITTTYQVVSPESAELGDVESQGWHDEEGETFETAQEAAEYLSDNFAHHPSESPSTNCKSWSTDGDKDYVTGNDKYYTYHIEASDKDVTEINSIYKGL